MAQDAEPRSANSPEEFPVAQGYFSLPRLLRAESAQANGNTYKLVTFVAQETFGWDFSRWVLLTYDEIIHGRRKANGERRGPGSGLPNDASVRRAIKDACENGLLEVQYMGSGTAYGIPQRYWLDSKLTPRWAFFRRMPYDPEEERQPAITVIAEQFLLPEPPASMMIASDNQNDSNPLSPREQPAITMLAQSSDEATLQAAPDEGIYTSPDTFINTNRDTSIDLVKEKKKKEESNPSSNQYDAVAPTSSPAPVGETIGTPPAPVSASEENSGTVEEDAQAQAEQVGQEAARRWLLAELAETRRRARDYRLSSSERLRAQADLRALEWTWRREFPDDPTGRPKRQ